MQVVGALDNYLNNVYLVEDNAELRMRIEQEKKYIQDFMGNLNADEIDEIVKMSISRISESITQLAEDLEKEHAGFPDRLDRRRLTVVADRDRLITMERMGSGENWLGFNSFGTCVVIPNRLYNPSSSSYTAPFLVLLV